MPPASNPRKDAHLRVELMEADDYAPFVLQSRADILFVLREIVRARDMLCAYYGAGNDFLFTSLLAVDDAGLILDWAASEASNQAALAAGRLVAVTSHEQVKIQFALPGMQRTKFEGRPAFRAALPERLLRLQRREYYRLVAPAAQPLRCRIRTDSGGTVDVQVLDLSGGGVALVSPPPGLPFAVDTEYDECRLELPGTGVVSAGLRVRNAFEVTLRNGNRVKRCGCQFVSLPASGVALIERYILRTERERKARQRGLA